VVREPEFVAPVVRILRTGGHVFLIAWQRDKHGRWKGMRRHGILKRYFIP
jgi:hypothetical protein